MLNMQLVYCYLLRHTVHNTVCLICSMCNRCISFCRLMIYISNILVGILHTFHILIHIQEILFGIQQHFFSYCVIIYILLDIILHILHILHIAICPIMTPICTRQTLAFFFLILIYILIYIQQYIILHILPILHIAICPICTRQTPAYYITY